IRGEKRSDFIKKILSKCPSLLLQTNAKGQTPLHYAAKNGHSAIVKLLIKSCAEARTGDLEQGTDQGSAVREMLRIRDKESNTVLHEAARCGNVEVLKALLEFKNPDFPYSANEKQETPLYIAARRRGSGRLLTLLLREFGSTPHGGPHGRTALHAAAMAGDAEAIRVILEEENLTKERDEDGHTALHYAAHLGSRISVVEELLKRDISAAYIGDGKRGMTPLLMAARQGDVRTVLKIISLCPDCCEKVDDKGLNLLHYLAFRGSFTLYGRSLFKLGGIEIAYGSLRNLMELKGDFGMTPQEVYNALISETQHHKQLTYSLNLQYDGLMWVAWQKQIKELLEEIENDQVAEEPVHHFPLRNVSSESLEKTINAHLVVAALIATVTFAAAITVPGGLNSDKGSEQGTPLLFDKAAFKAFFATNTIAFILSVIVLANHFGILDTILSGFSFWRRSVFYRTQSVAQTLGIATLMMVIAFVTGSFVILKPSNDLNSILYLINPGLSFFLWLMAIFLLRI
ncbi:hypothetical protein V6Z11_A04G184300, partial [Gossypium hirsutum]